MTDKTPVIIRDDYAVFYEPITINTQYDPNTIENRLFVFVHCDVKRWTPSVKRALSRDFNLLISLIDMPLFAMHTNGDTKHLKFLTLFGFKHYYSGDDVPDKSFFILEN